MQRDLISAANHARPIVSRMLRHHREDTEDVLQQTSLQVWRKRDSFRGESSFSTWFCAVAIRFCLMKLRRKTYRTASLDDAFSLADHRAPNPERRAIARDMVNRILPRLNPQERVAFILLSRGWTMEQIGQMRGKTTGSVKAEIWRARRDVREMLQEQEGFEAVTSKGERGAK